MISEEHKQRTIDNIDKYKDTKKNNDKINKNSKGYLSQENVKEYNQALQKKVFSNSRVGKRYAFDRIENLEEEIMEYFDLCTDKCVVPTITNLALWLGVHRDTIYAHAHDSNSPYSDIMKNCISYLHAVIQNGTIDGKINPVTYIFISKNDYGMRDDKNIKLEGVEKSTNFSNQETMDAIHKQLEEENIQNAEFTEVNED